MNRANSRKLIAVSDTIRSDIPRPFMRYASALGALGFGDDKINANTNLSGVGATYKVVPDFGQATRIMGAALTFAYTAGTLRMDGYAGGGALANGLKIKVSYDSGASYANLLGFDTITTARTTLQDLLSVADRWEFSTMSTGPHLGVIYFNYKKQFGHPLRLDGNDAIIVECNDDFSNLTKHTFLFTGYYEAP